MLLHGFGEESTALARRPERRKGGLIIIVAAGEAFANVGRRLGSVRGGKSERGKVNFIPSFLVVKGVVL